MNDLYPTRKISDGIQAIQARWPQAVSDSAESPVFILSAGWRSGSTLLQRLLMPECFVWGEPYGHAWMIDSLAQTIRSMTDAWPEPHFIYKGQDAQALTRQFIANLYPPPEHLVKAHLQYFDAMFVKPARAAGAERWGIKEVRLSADHAAYLKWLYPKAKLIFLFRNPYDAYRSYAARREAGYRWYNRWPDRPLTTAEFGRHWRTLTSGFLEQAESLDALVVRYEHLAQGHYEDIRSYLGLNLCLEAANTRPSEGLQPLGEIRPMELAELEDELGELASSLGHRYGAPKKPSGPMACHPGKPTGNSKCVVLVPVASHIEPACEAGLQELERRGYRVRRVRGYSAIDQGRNQMATDALRDGFEETMWIDSDIGFHADAVDRLRSHGLPIVCGVYPKKGRRELACHVLPGTQKIVFGQEGGLAEVLYGGAGFLLVRRDAYTQIQRQLRLPSCNDAWGSAMIPFFQPMAKPHRDGYWYLAEDFAFCQRARQCGYKIMADTSIRLSHYGTYGYTWEEAGIDPRRYATFHYHLSGAEPASSEAVRPGRSEREVPDVGPSPSLEALAAAHPWPAEKPCVPPNRHHGWLMYGARQSLQESLSAQTRVVVELGSWMGLSTRFIADHAPNAVVIAVDHWKGSPEHQASKELRALLPQLYDTFLASCWEYRDRIVPVRASTLEGMREIAGHNIQPDLIYIDADHAYESVKADLEEAIALFPKSRIVGDDWDWPGVRRSVTDVCTARGFAIESTGNSWRLKHSKD